MGKSHDETHGEFPDIEKQSNEGGSSRDFKLVKNEFLDLDDGNSYRRIGRYRLIRPIGEGGMGVVWHAVQEHPVKRDVALKLVRKDLGKDALVRFEGERQAIAMMDHPNIAKILDAGTTEDGSPYFVMELVKGIPLDQYCNSRKLNIEQRLRLVIQVCRAVQHAHQKAILHRDLKHSNILVSENDDEATPKVIDFGLAKALGGQNTLTDKTVFTEFGRVVGTISYMSPEQADTGGMDIDTRSDIYSLGVVFYKLLTGRTPIQMEGDSLTMVGAINIIREKDPIAPSVAVRKYEDCTAWANDSTTLSAERLSGQLRGDLDSIVLKALEKDRRGRYETANSLALDIERYLNQETVLAQPRSTTYAIRKFVQRNKGLVASLATIAALLIGGIVATSLSLLFAISATDRAELNAELYKLETAKAKNAEKLRRVQLKAQLNKSAWSNLQRNNVETAWQSLRQMRELDPQNPGWIGRYLSNEMDTCKPENMMLGGHANYVLTVDASSGGDFVLSGGVDDAVCLWNARNNQLIYRRFFDDIVKCVRFSGNQKQFAVADRSNIISIYETSSGNRIRKIGPFEQDASSLCFHPHLPVLACGFFGNDSARSVGTSRDLKHEKKPAPLILINFESGETLQTLDGHPGEITSVVFDASGERLVSSCVDGNLRVWKASRSSGDSSDRSDGPNSKLDFRPERTIVAHPGGGGVSSVDISQDGKLIASSGDDKAASLWDAETGKLIVNLIGHTEAVYGVAISKDGKRISTCGNDHKVIIWNLKGEQIVTWRGHTKAINEVCFTADGQQVISASDDQSLRRWNTHPVGEAAAHYYVQESHEVWRDTHEVWRADFSPDKDTVAAASENCVVHLIGSRDGKLKKDLQHDGAVLSLVWLSDGRLITAGDSFGMWVWDRPDQVNAKLKPVKKIELPGPLTWSLSVSPDEDRIMAASSDGTARIFDLTSFKELGVLDDHEAGLATAAFSPDGKLIATGCDDWIIRIWDARTYELLYTLDEHEQLIWRVVFSPADPNLMASSAADGTIYLWDLESRQRLPVVFAGHQDAVAGLTFSADGKSLVSASDDRTVRVWDIETGVELFVFQDQMTEVMIHASFSKDGQSLVTCGVGVVNVRHASKIFRSPYLQRDSVRVKYEHGGRIDGEDLTREELEEIVSGMAKVVNNYPDWDGWMIHGIALYRVDRHTEAIESLEESLRLSFIYNSPESTDPSIEGYLALAYFKAGKIEKAREMKKTFELRADTEYWNSSAAMDQLRSDVNAAIGD